MIQNQDDSLVTCDEIRKQIQSQVFYLRTLASALERGSVIAETIPQPVELVLECLTDVALALKQASLGHLDRSPEIFESKTQVDSLGNVQMIHRKPKRYEIASKQIEDLSQSIVSACCQIRSYLGYSQNILDNFDKEDFYLDEIEIVSLEARKRASQRMSRIESMNRELNFLNRKVVEDFSSYIGHTELRIENLVRKIQQKRSIISTLHHRLNAYKKLT